MPSAICKLCLSVMPQDARELRQLAGRIDGADLAELRLDLFQKIDFREIRDLFSLPLIITLRPTGSGGYRTDTNRERLSLFRGALEAGIEFIDVEWEEAAQILPNLGGKVAGRLVLSHHTPENDPDRLREVLREMLKTPAAVYKLIYTVRQFKDNLIAPRLLHEFSAGGNRRLVIHGMGDGGSASRLIGAVRGNTWTYVASDKSARTAAGQITLQEARNDYFLTEKSRDTRIVGLAGFPVAQSRGWRFHNRLLHLIRRRSNDKPVPIRDFLYLNFPVARFDHFWQSWRNVLAGLSITLPHKEIAARFADRISAGVKKSGVCNTLISRHHQWWGFNTDLLALLEILRPHAGRMPDGILIIGSGGTARSAIAACRELGIAPIWMTGRNREKGEFLSRQLGVRFRHFNAIDDVRVSGMIQTTPLGMVPDTDQCPPVTQLLRPGQIILDVIYNPPVTKFLRAAQEKGATVISGREMYLRQALHQFRLFSGVAATLADAEVVWREITEDEEGANHV